MTRRIIHHLSFGLLLTAIASLALADYSFESAETPALVAEARNVLGMEASKSSEKQLEQIVLTLGSRSDTPAARALVEELSTRSPQILLAHEEGGQMIPFVDVGAAARVTLRNWIRRDAQQQALHLMRTGDTQFLQKYFAADTTQQAGMIDAAGHADVKDLVLYRDELITRVSEPGGDKLAAVFAVALADAALFEQVIAKGSAGIALDSIRQLQKTLGADAALLLMRSALKRSDIASATLYEIGGMMRFLPAADILLWESLADARLGGSAAAVLARHADSGTVERLARVLQDSDAELVRKRVVLALRLSGDAHALQIANEWLARQPGAGR